jgi:hypothetical protein
MADERDFTTTDDPRKIVRQILLADSRRGFNCKLRTDQLEPVLNSLSALCRALIATVQRYHDVRASVVIDSTYEAMDSMPRPVLRLVTES